MPISISLLRWLRARRSSFRTSAEPGVRLAGLPDRFDDVDLAILDWITAEGRRIGRNVARVSPAPRLRFLSPARASGRLERPFARQRTRR